MKGKLRLHALSVMALLILGLFSSRATTFLELQSTYLGNGWFQYQMSLMNDPFFREADITSFIINFTNEVSSSSSSQNWTNSSYSSPYSYWDFNSAAPARPYTETMLLQSSLTSFRTGTNLMLDGALVIVSLTPSDYYPGISSGPIYSSIVGVAGLDCLVPCAPADADGSPTNLDYVLKIVPDVNINQLIVENGGVYGVDFTWSNNSTFLLQSSRDLQNWTNINYIWSTPPETVWTTNQNLAAYGQFFRVELAADGYATNLPLNAANVQLAKTQAIPKTGSVVSLPRVTSCKPAAGQIAVTIATEANQACTVEALDSHQKVLQTRQVSATGNSATVSFSSGSLPNPVFFQVAASK